MPPAETAAPDERQGLSVVPDSLLDFAQSANG